MQAAEKLKPVDTELRRIEASVNEIVQEMEYLRMREQKLRDTNESTNERVKWFALGTMGMLVGLGAWQVVYLRAYFRYVSRVQLLLLRGNGCYLVPLLRQGWRYGMWDTIANVLLQVEASHLDVYNIDQWFRHRIAYSRDRFCRTTRGSVSSLWSGLDDRVLRP